MVEIARQRTYALFETQPGKKPEAAPTEDGDISDIVGEGE